MVIVSLQLGNDQGQFDVADDLKMVLTEEEREALMGAKDNDSDRYVREETLRQKEIITLHNVN